MLLRRRICARSIVVVHRRAKRSLQYIALIIIIFFYIFASFIFTFISLSLWFLFLFFFLKILCNILFNFFFIIIIKFSAHQNKQMRERLISFIHSSDKFWDWRNLNDNFLEHTKRTCRVKKKEEETSLAIRAGFALLWRGVQKLRARMFSSSYSLALTRCVLFLPRRYSGSPMCGEACIIRWNSQRRRRGAAAQTPESSSLSLCAAIAFLCRATNLFNHWRSPRKKERERGGFCPAKE